MNDFVRDAQFKPFHNKKKACAEVKEMYLLKRRQPFGTNGIFLSFCK